MSNFNPSINASSLLGILNESKKSFDDQYISDRNTYMAGRRGSKVEYSTQRQQDMHMMGAAAHRHLGDPA